MKRKLFDWIKETRKKINWKNMSTRNKLSLMCGGLAVICIAVIIWLIVDYFVWTAESEAKIEAMREKQKAIATTQEPNVTQETNTTQEQDATQEDVGNTENPYAEFFGQNEDMAAWLYVPDTKIDYPVMQTMENETYYIDKDFYGNPDKAGCLLLDTDSSLTQTGTTNLIIHGHNMKAGTMFGELEKYQDEAYCKEHGKVLLYTEEDVRQYEVISVFYSQVYYVTDQVFKYYNFFEAKTQEEFNDFYDNIKKMSLVDTGVVAELGDSFITLSTCAYHVEDGRFVVVAKEVSRSSY